MSKLKQYKMFINGEWVDSESKKTFETLNPENNEPWAVVPEASAKDVNNAIKDSELKIIKDGKHLCGIECADEVNLSIKNFIEKYE